MTPHNEPREYDLLTSTMTNVIDQSDLPDGGEAKTARHAEAIQAANQRLYYNRVSSNKRSATPTGLGVTGEKNSGVGGKQHTLPSEKMP